MSAQPAASLPASLERIRTSFEQRSAPHPALRDAQRAALERFLAHGFPTTREEAWHYTNLRRLESRAFVLAPPAADVPVSADQLPDFGAARVVFVNGVFAPKLSETTCAGLTVRTLQNGALESSFLQRTLTSVSSPFRDLNTALLHEVVVVELTANTDCALPVHLMHVWTDSATPQMSHPRLLFRAGNDSRLTLIEHYLCTADTEHFTNAQTFVELGDGAQLTHCLLQEESTKAFHVGAVQTDVGRDARYLFTDLALGGTLARTDLHVRLTAPGGRADIDGLMFPSGTQHIDVHTLVDHLAPQTFSDENFRGIADDRGRGVFNGKAVVHKDAQKIEAHQSTRNILLSATAEIDSKPDLEIYANDVKCSHGATTGRLDPVSMFYLRSRGIGEHEARVLLIHAFAESVLSAVPGEQLRAYLHDRLAAKLRRLEVTV
jgi:Fe-S cluster assembly protein SufD